MTTSNDGSDSDSDSVVVNCPDLEITKTADAATFKTGEAIGFTITVSNAGPGVATGVKVTDTLPATAGLSWSESPDSPDCSIAGGVLSCDFGTLAAGASRSVHVTSPTTAASCAVIDNEATVTADNDQPESDSASVRCVAIDIEKTGPATATVGAALNYTLTVTNPGTTAFPAQQVIVTDPKCEAPPAGPNTGSDATPGTLDPGDTWTYTCTAQTAGQPAGTFVNTANVTGKDVNGRDASDTDDFPTLLQAQVVLPQPEIVNGTARLRGPSGCVRVRSRRPCAVAGSLA